MHCDFNSVGGKPALLLSQLPPCTVCNTIHYNRLHRSFDKLLATVNLSSTIHQCLQRFSEQCVLILLRATGFLYFSLYPLCLKCFSLTVFIIAAHRCISHYIQTNKYPLNFFPFPLLSQARHFLLLSVRGNDWPLWCCVICVATDVDFQGIKGIKGLYIKNCNPSSTSATN